MRELSIDSSVLISLYEGNLAAKQLMVESHPNISIVVYAELCRYFKRKLGGANWDRVKSDLGHFRILPLDTETCELAAEVSRRHALSIVDSLIYASALKNGMPLATTDADLKGKRGVIFVR